MAKRTHKGKRDPWQEVEGKCNGRLRTGKGLCGQTAGMGTPHLHVGRCKLHGGCSPTHVINAERIMTVQACETYGLPRDVEPHVALLEEIARTAGHVDWLGAKVRGEEDLGEKSFELRLYKSERHHLVDVCKAAITCGIAERQVKIAEAQGQLIVRVLDGVLEAIGVDREDETVRKEVSRQLRLVSGEEAA